MRKKYIIHKPIITSYKTSVNQFPSMVSEGPLFGIDKMVSRRHHDVCIIAAKGIKMSTTIITCALTKHVSL